MKTLIVKKLSLGLALFGLLTGAVHAIPIVGSVEYSSSMSPLDGAGGSITTLGSADYLDFAPLSGTSIGDGDLAGLTGFFGSLALSDFSIDPFASPTLVWSSLVGAAPYTFTLTSLSINEQNDSWLKLSGSGYFSDMTSTLDDTDAVWSLTAQDAGDPSPILTFSASSASVPEPSTLMLLGVAMLGMGMRRFIVRS